MKTKAIKFVIPALAVLFAIATSAFTALDNPNAAEKMAMNGYIPTGNFQNPCELIQDVDCNLTGSQLCTYGGAPVYEKIQGTSCVNQLRRDPQ
ncbi:DUF6520 family protein [Muricauda sp. 334s03]|uniref:DUF6520 family protein n=1 Tax=Flagellimonas yonaguniensis TaxID=3031325 RepID=A0ABT5Y0M3_9FLAO|nr:DUF6520 family protein [[Muricauda] yonaguniensis]MDF0716985.1 DUF6520 family protein [[Muricauda] yonaguniensis]